MGLPLIAGTAAATAAPLVAGPVIDRVTGGDEPEQPQLFGYPRSQVLAALGVGLAVLGLVVMSR